MDAWGWQQLQPWLATRLELPVGPLAQRRGAGRSAADRGHGRGAATLCPAPAAPRPCGRVPLVVIQRQLGHGNLGITSVYLQGIDNAEIIETVNARPTPTVQVNALLRR
jgi:hypothetical protein